MRRRDNRFLIPSLLLLAIVIVAGNAVVAYRAVKTVGYADYWVQHTWEVMFQVERIMGTAKDAETGTRGFVISGNDAYLEPYTSAQRDMPAQLDLFLTLTRDNDSQKDRLEEMRSVIQSRFATLSNAIVVRRTQGFVGNLALVKTGTGRAEMTHLREVADRIEQEERRLLQQRLAESAASTRRALLSVAVASGLDFLLIAFVFYYFAHERQLRLAKEEIAESLAVAHSVAQARSQEIQQLNTELEERVRQRTADLQTTNRELEAFSYSVSHDLRAPLRTIDGFSLALEEDYATGIDDTGRDYIRRVRTGVQRMGQLIDALLQLSRITRAEIVREPVDLSAIAQLVASDLTEANLSQTPPGTPITFHIQPGMDADADPKLIQVALENLLNNAAKFSSKVAAPVIEFGHDPEQNAFFIRDNGAGFDMYYSEKLFNAFNRLHGDKDFKGSGIGLATVARVIHRHRGRIWAHSEVGNGATFWFTLG